MGWKHIVMEANCLFNWDISVNDLEMNIAGNEKELPHCCKFGPERISINCLRFDEDENKYCPFLAFGKARTSIVLTGINSEEESCKVFWTDENLTSDEWVEKEELWINEWKKKINE